MSKSPSKGSTEGRQHLAERFIRFATTVFSVLLCGVAGFLALERPGGGLVTLSYDLPFLLHRGGGGSEVRAVYLDEMKGEVLNREIQAPLLDRLYEAGARAVVYDILFDSEWPDPAVDEAFAASIRRFRGVDETGKPIPGARRGIVVLACGRQKLEQTGVLGEQLIPPTDRILEAAGDEFGLVALSHVDYVVREVATGTRDEVSLAWKAAQALGAGLEESSRLEPRWINYVGPPPHPDDPDAKTAIGSFPAQAVLSDANPEMFRDKIIIVGGRPGIVSPRLGEDLFATPFHRIDFGGKLPYMSGVEVQANILANLLEGDWLRRSGRPLELGFVLLSALVCGIVFSRLRPLPALVAALLGIGLLALAGLFAVHFGRFWFPWSIIAFVEVPVGLVGGTAAHFYVERHFRRRLSEERQRLRDALSRYLSPKMLERVAAEDFHLKLGGDKLPAAMMFTDIESFTGMCQAVGDPQLIVENLNGYFERTTSHIFDHDGVVIKFIGDAIFAAWGVPFHDEQAAVKSVRAAWKVFEHAKFVAEGSELRTRVGLHFGEVVAGNIGSTRHIDYTLIGDAVNLASRLEALNKTLGTSILLSGEVRECLGEEFRTRRVGRFRVMGRQEATEVYDLLGPASQTGVTDWMKTYEGALAAFESGEIEKARSLFRQADKERISGDGPSRFFERFLAEGGTAPDGVVELMEK